MPGSPQAEVLMRRTKRRIDSLLPSLRVLLSVLLSSAPLAPYVAIENQLGSRFPAGWSGGDGGELNSATCEFGPTSDLIPWACEVRLRYIFVYMCS